VDESGHSADAGAADGGDGADSRERTRVNGWATPDSPWSHAGSAPDADGDVPAWRRSSSESHPFALNPAFPTPVSSAERPVGPQPAPVSAVPAQTPVPMPAPPGFVDSPGSGAQYVGAGSGEIPSSVDTAAPAPWSGNRARYSDLLAHLSPSSGEPARPPEPRTQARAAPPPDSLPHAGSRSPSAPPRGFDLPTPSSAPPYPYEGDLDDERTVPSPPAVPQRTAVPLVRPAAPGGRVDWTPADPAQEPARHAFASGTPVQGLPRVEGPGRPHPLSRSDVSSLPEAPARPGRPETLSALPTDEAKPGRPTYDPSSFPRRSPYETVPSAGAPGHAPPVAYSGFGPRPAEKEGPRAGTQSTRVLPQRVPAQPDVPRVPEPPLVEPTAETPALARIATHLRRGDVLPAQERQEGFDVQAILAAVREVDGVRDASLRSTPAGAHSLRLDLAEGADPAEVSRRVARLLQDRMGLDAAMQGDGQGVPEPAASPPPAQPAQPAPIAAAPARGLSGSSSGALVPSQPNPAKVTPPAAPVSPPRTPGVSAPPAAAVSAPPAPAPAAPPADPPRPEYVSPRPADETHGQHESASPDRRDGEGERHEGTMVPAGVECGPPRPLHPGERPGPRVMIENVHVNTSGTDASVEVRLTVDGRTASGEATGPAVDGYLLRLCAMATAGAVDELLSTSDHPEGPARCFVEHAAAVPFGASQVAVVVLLLSTGGWVEQLAGSAVVVGDDRHAMVRATLAAVNRRLEALLSR
jgi:hypothetical protein